MSYLDSCIDSNDATRVRIQPDGRGKAVLLLSEFDTDCWSGTDEAHLDITGLRALAALALIVAEELERASKPFTCEECGDTCDNAHRCQS